MFDYAINNEMEASGNLPPFLTLNPSNEEMSVMAKKIVTPEFPKSKSKPKKQFSIEHRRKLSDAAKKRWQDPEYRKEMAQIEMSDECKKSISDRMKAAWQDPEYRKNHPKNNLSESARRSISDKAKERWSDPEYKSRVAKKIGKTAKEIWERPGYKEKMSKSLKGIQAGENNHMYGKHPSEETRQKMRDSHNDWQVGELHPMYGKRHSAESRKKMSDAHIGIQAGENHPMYGQHHSDEAKEKMIAAHLGIPLSGDHKKKIGKASKNVWDTISEEKRNEWQGNIRKALACSPNKPEQIILSTLNYLYPGEWEFVGDGQLIIAGKCPDFVNVNGQKKLIELFGDYWHRGQDPKDRINIFKPYGFDTLVIWEHELKEMGSVIEKIQNFMEM